MFTTIFSPFSDNFYPLSESVKIVDFKTVSHRCS